ncbi:probable G-protein coupled receptor 160 [Conger conger]|uniref:probable G-protein coupled receptor 160 n=1 Tax=Conger conger TaxID=82655 RepID=UPI002A59C878|nr:probable G-protein coupled receptor 160 [Conger conger]XP_061114969.1 probable G-protein coupled receptor 160 [Conger conger]XP_061114970.1 probable G-protein coupled receptor 160 [Conger conger]XP_061114971.1 probable G-protein coupled receptor 160 [Conger conger]
MLSSNDSGWRMLAVLERQDWAGSGSSQDNGLQFLGLMLFKACLNVWPVAISRRSLQRSLVGVGGISLCLADVLLLCATAGSWALRGRVSTSVSLCFTMSHASTVYALLPVPFLLLGALDYARNLGDGTRSVTPCRAVSCCTQVLSVWALAGLYSYRYTSSQVITVSETQQSELFCMVKNSAVVDYSCTGLSLALVCVLFFYYQSRPGHFWEVLQWPRLRETTPSSQADIRSHEEAQQEVQQEAQPDGPGDIPLLLRLALGFALTWGPFVTLSAACVLLNMPIPAYLSVNIIWLLCSNSVLLAAALWVKRERAWACEGLPDDTCAWSLYWRHGNGGLESKLQEELPHDIYTLSSSSTEKLLLV